MSAFHDVVKQFLFACHLPTLFFESARGATAALLPIFVHALSHVVDLPVGRNTLTGVLVAVAGMAVVAANPVAAVCLRVSSLWSTLGLSGLLYASSTTVLLFGGARTLLRQEGPQEITAVLVLLGLTSALWGAAFSFLSIPRLVFSRDPTFVPPAVRASLLSVVGGCQRWGMVFGPFLAGVAVDGFASRYHSDSSATLLPSKNGTAPVSQPQGLPIVFGSADAFLSIHVPCGIAASLCFLAHRLGWLHTGSGHSGPARTDGLGASNADVGDPSVISVLRAHCFLASFAWVMSALRSVRPLLLAFSAIALGFCGQGVGALIGVSYLVDAVLFFISSLLIRRWGAERVGGLCSATLGVAFLVLWLLMRAEDGSSTAAPTTCRGGEVSLGFADLVTSATALRATAVAALFGACNSIGSGVLLSLLSTHAPPSPSGGNGALTVLRSVLDLGAVAGPPLVGLLVDYTTVATAALVFAVLAAVNALGAALLLRPLSTAPLLAAPLVEVTARHDLPYPTVGTIQAFDSSSVSERG